VKPPINGDIPDLLAKGDRPATIDPVARLLRLRELAGESPRIVVAFSGGMDSTVLAHALIASRRRLPGLRLVHIDHGLQSASAKWARRCAALARQWRVPFVSLRADIVRKRGESPEAAARATRYALLANAMQPGEVLVTAQHRDDQAETVLLQLFRGAGVAGLAAMPEIAPFGAGLIVRPLLDASREQIAAYARTHRLAWIDDPTNAETRFSRNYLRHHVMPAIRERWPTVDAAIARTAGHMAEAQSLLATLAHTDLARIADGGGIKVTGLRALPRARRKNALRAFIARCGVDAPATTQLMEIAGALLRARPDANPEQRFNGVVLRRQGGRLEVRADAHGGVENVAKSWHWPADRTCVLNEQRHTLSLLDDPAGPIDLERLPDTFVIRARRGGESLRPGLRSRTQSLKKLLQSARIDVDARARLPLLYTGKGPKGRLIAVGDRWIDASIAANVKSRRRARLKWTTR
jgi:tRNA(Ile)-lysidine synthase